MYPSHPEIERLVAAQHRRQLAQQVAAHRRPAGAGGRRPGPGLVARLRTRIPGRRSGRRVLTPQPAHPG